MDRGGLRSPVCTQVNPGIFDGPVALTERMQVPELGLIDKVPGGNNTRNCHREKTEGAR